MTKQEKVMRLRTICRGILRGESLELIAVKVGLTQKGLKDWMYSSRDARFLIVPQDFKGNRNNERTARAHKYIHGEGKPREQKTCTRVFGREDGKTIYCGKPTSRNRCVACEVALNYRHIPQADGHRFVSRERGL
jgi:hypothetical protein